MKKMDSTIGFQAGRGTEMDSHSFDRTSEGTDAGTRGVRGRPEALIFLKDSQAEGYRSSGADLVDPEQKLFQYLIESSIFHSIVLMTKPSSREIGSDCAGTAALAS